MALLDFNTPDEKKVWIDPAAVVLVVEMELNLTAVAVLVLSTGDRLRVCDPERRCAARISKARGALGAAPL